MPKGKGDQRDLGVSLSTLLWEVPVIILKHSKRWIIRKNLETIGSNLSQMLFYTIFLSMCLKSFSLSNLYKRCFDATFFLTIYLILHGLIKKNISCFY